MPTLKLMIKNLVSMLLTKRMIIWALEVATKQTDNKIDDNVVKLLTACYENDALKLRESAEAILKDIKSK